MNDEHSPASTPDQPLVQHVARRTRANSSVRSTTLTDFEIVREIGRGGTAIVYEAHQKSLRRHVALKRLPAAATLDQRWLGRFRNEVRAASQLDHPNIVPFYEFGQDDESHFYTMQLVDGISLAEVIHRLRQCRASIDCASRPCMDQAAVHPAFLRLCERCQCRFACRDVKTPLDTAEKTDLVVSPSYHRAVADLVRDVALAVDYAHDQGILHLDVKPSNLLIDGEGKLWITDFGASRPNSGSESSDALSGTLCYMSPEQALGRNEELDCRSDVYSLGATLYELLTLERPFVHESPHALLTQVALDRFKPPRHVNQALPPELDEIIVKAMASSPPQRYATARELAEELEKFLSTSTTRSSTRQSGASSRRRQVLMGLFTTVTLACLAQFAIAPWRDSFPSPVFEWNGHFYALTNKATDWVSAEAEAVAHGGHLITINDRQEQEFVVDTFLSPPDQVFWIGMTDAEKEGAWHWVSGEPVEYSNWENRGEPNNVIWRNSDTGETIDEDYGVINWHFIVEPPRRRACTWNDINSARNNDRMAAYRGILEFESDPRFPP